MTGRCAPADEHTDGMIRTAARWIGGLASTRGWSQAAYGRAPQCTPGTHTTSTITTSSMGVRNPGSCDLDTLVYGTTTLIGRTGGCITSPGGGPTPSPSGAAFWPLRRDRLGGVFVGFLQHSCEAMGSGVQQVVAAFAAQRPDPAPAAARTEAGDSRRDERVRRWATGADAGPGSASNRDRECPPCVVGFSHSTTSDPHQAPS
jgi:hypothetical protein